VRKPLEPHGAFVPNLAPMVDVIMVLLVFFLLGATLQLAEQGVLQTELDPSSGPNPGQAVSITPRVMIGLQDRADGTAAAVSLNDDVLGENAFDALRELLERRRQAGADVENPVVIGADTDVRWRFVVKAMDAAVQAGFKNIQFAVSMRPAGG
jgi:biopolymer transport protein ExbD